MLQNFCEFSPDYTAPLRKLKDPLNLRASERIIQFPFTLPTTEEKTEEELAREASDALQKAERRRQARMDGREDELSDGGAGDGPRKRRKLARAPEADDLHRQHLRPKLALREHARERDLGGAREDMFWMTRGVRAAGGRRM